MSLQAITGGIPATAPPKEPRRWFLKSIIATYYVAIIAAVWFLLHALHARPEPVTSFIATWLLAPFFGVALVALDGPLTGLIDNRAEYGKVSSPRTRAAFWRKVRGTMIAVHVSLAGNIVSITSTFILSSVWPNASSSSILLLVLPPQMLVGSGSYYWTQSVLASRNPHKLGQFQIAGEKASEQSAEAWKRQAVQALFVISLVLVILLPASILITGAGLYRTAPAWMAHWGGTVLTLVTILAMGTLVDLFSTRASIKARTNSKTFVWSKGSEEARRNAAQMWHNWRIATARNCLSYGAGLWLATLPQFRPSAALRLPYAHQLTQATVGLVQQTVSEIDLLRSWVNGRARRNELTRTLDTTLVLASDSIERSRAMLAQGGGIVFITLLLEGTGLLGERLRELRPSESAREVLDVLLENDELLRQFTECLADTSVRQDLLSEQTMREALADLATLELADKFRETNPKDMELGRGIEAPPGTLTEKSTMPAPAEHKQPIDDITSLLGQITAAISGTVGQVQETEQQRAAALLRVSEAQAALTRLRLPELTMSLLSSRPDALLQNQELLQTFEASNSQASEVVATLWSSLSEASAAETRINKLRERLGKIWQTLDSGSE